MRGTIFRNLSAAREMLILLLAFAAGLAAAVATMFAPAHILEALTARTGIAQVLPAAQPPLGDFARALIAFGVAVLATAAALVVLALIALRLARRNDDFEAAAPAVQEEAERAVPEEAEPAPGLLARLVQRARGGGEDAIRDLSDLPKLRAADRHPDAPARRPLIASTDLGDPLDAPADSIAVPVVAAPIIAPIEIEAPIAMPAPVEAEPVAEAAPFRPLGRAEPAPAPFSAAATIAAIVTREARPEEIEPSESVAAMLDRLEQSISRNGALADLPDAGAVTEPSAYVPPVTPAAPLNGSMPMDDALRSALKSLGRMSALR